ncbi:hypothetical protein [Streptomyces sp. SYSU K217416]
MSTGVIIILLVVAVLVLAVVVARPFVAGRGGGSGRDLRRRFGPEYERTVTQHDGDTKAAEKELAERLHRHESLEVRPLATEAHTQYVAAWAGVQEKFVDSPARAVADADRLLGRLARDRGFPDDSHDTQVAALSVHHPHHVDGFRRLHMAAHRASGAQGQAQGQEHGEVGTEELREVLVGARALFEELATTERTDSEHTRPAARAATGRRNAPWAVLRRRDTGR